MMANSLEFSPSGHPIENRYDGYGDDIASGYEGRYGDPDQEAQDRITLQIDEKRAAFLASGEVDDYDPFAPIETDEERQERRDAEMDAWGEAYGCLDDDQDEDAGE